MNVTYKGPSSRDDVSTEFVVKHEGTAYRLRQGVPTDVPDELATELLEGKGRVKGHKFAEADEQDTEAPAEPTTAAGSGGSGGTDTTTGGGTARAAART